MDGNHVVHLSCLLSGKFNVTESFFAVLCLELQLFVTK